LIELLYVSEALLPPHAQRVQFDRILSVARVRNLALGVTGALICMDGLFAQVLEGREEAVNQLMVAILRDSRHAEVRIVRVSEIADRRFANWSMAEIAPDPAAAGLLAALNRPERVAPNADTAEALIRLMAAHAGSARL
jgi:hypothetical protein